MFDKRNTRDINPEKYKKYPFGRGAIYSKGSEIKLFRVIYAQKGKG